MKKNISLTIILIAIACIAVLVMPAKVSAEVEVVASGICGADGDNVTWTLGEDGLMTISGGGEMADYSAPYSDNPCPWVDHLSEIQYVWVSNGITYIGQNAFNGCTNLEEAYLPIGLTSIGSYTFANCSNLVNVELRENISSIGSYAFNNCTSLSSITIPSSLISISSGVFSNSGLQSIVIPANVTRIEATAFAGSKQLSEVTLLEGLETIGYSAFSNCSALKTITIPASVTNLDPSLIYYAGGLTAVYIDEDNKNYCDVDGVVYDKAMTRLIGWPSAKTGTCTIPQGVSTIESNAFSGSKLDAVFIPESVTSIASYAFYNCTISDIYYAGTSSEWTSVAVGSENTGLQNATMHYAAHSGTCGANATWVLYDDGLLVISGTGDMFDYQSIYQSSTNISPWYNYNSQIKAITVGSAITRIGDYAFYGSSAESFMIQDASLSMGTWSVGNNLNLTNIDFGTGTISPGNNVFEDCEALTTVHIPANVIMNGSGSGEGSGYDMFHSCGELTTAIVDCTYIGRFIFEGDSKLSSVTFTDPNVKFYFLEDGGSMGGSGNPFNSISNATITLTGYTCSDVPKLTEEASNSSYRRLLVFEPIEGDPGHRDVVEDLAVAATCEETGLTAGSHCTVCGQVIVAQEEVPALGHSWGTPTYVWAEDNSSVTATAVCTRDANHTVEEQVSIVSEISQEATCTEAGERTYTATFTKEPFTTQTRSEEIPAIPHSPEHHELDPATCGDNGTLEHWQCSMCKKYFSDAECTTEISESDLVISAPENHTLVKTEAVPATCGAEGNSAYWTCSVCGKYFSDAGFTECEEGSWVVPQTGHEYGEPVWTWSDDYSTVTATFTCVHDETHTLERTVSIKDGSIKLGKRIEAQRHTDGYQDYTAKIVGPNGTEYANETTQILPATHKVHKDKKSKDNKSMAIDVETDTLKAAVSGDVSAAAPALIASYGKDGRFLGLEVVTAPTEAVDPAKDAESLKILWIDSSGYKPQSEAEEIDRKE